MGEPRPHAGSDRGNHCTQTRAPGTLTLYMWANSISKGVSRERGGGFTVTEMTLEFSTVVFLAGQIGSSIMDPACTLWPAPLTASMQPTLHLLSPWPAPCSHWGFGPPCPPALPTSAEPRSCPDCDRARCRLRIQMSHPPLEGSTWSPDLTCYLASPRGSPPPPTSVHPGARRWKSFRPSPSDSQGCGRGKMVSILGTRALVTMTQQSLPLLQ